MQALNKLVQTSIAVSEDRVRVNSQNMGVSFAMD
jgi:hypothetical protein